MAPKTTKPAADPAAGAAAPPNQDQASASAPAASTDQGADQGASSGQAAGADQGQAGDQGADQAAELADVTDENYFAVMRARVPKAILDALDQADPDGDAAVLFAEACEVYGINPDPAAREVISEVVYYPGDHLAVPPTPDRVVFVTAGGLKVSQPMTDAFEEQLRRWLKAYRMNRATGELEPTDLPADLTLPREAVTGISTRTEHRYEGGYLRSRALASTRSARR